MISLFWLYCCQMPWDNDFLGKESVSFQTSGFDPCNIYFTFIGLIGFLCLCTYIFTILLELGVSDTPL